MVGEKWLKFPLVTKFFLINKNQIFSPIRYKINGFPILDISNHSEIVIADTGKQGVGINKTFNENTSWMYEQILLTWKQNQCSFKRRSSKVWKKTKQVSKTTWFTFTGFLQTYSNSKFQEELEISFAKILGISKYFSSSRPQWKCEKKYQNISTKTLMKPFFWGEGVWIQLTWNQVIRL